MAKGSTVSVGSGGVTPIPHADAATGMGIGNPTDLEALFEDPGFLQWLDGRLEEADSDPGPSFGAEEMLRFMDGMFAKARSELGS